ncbi:urease subunit beta [Spirillospora sp. NBC_01491]|uniref:urease subunit beta n=1 Tax=Spirillospora sp. NBC_01491 TaxID=2976007 RepID=UPI002E34BFB3|nr:urease subunit beta [Spirillospora sp. NBC_01491]
MPDYIYGEGSIEINAGRSVVTMTVRNTGDRAVQIGSHYHFFEANRALSFDRERAYGRRLDIPAGTAVRIEAGDSHRVDLVEYGGGMRVVGFAGLVNGGLRSEQTHRNAVARMAEQGFQNVRDATVKVRKPKSAKTELEVPKAARAAAKRPAAKKAAGKAAPKAAGKAAPKAAPKAAAKTAGRAAPKRTAAARTSKGAVTAKAPSRSSRTRTTKKGKS